MFNVILGICKLKEGVLNNIEKFSMGKYTIHLELWVGQ